MLNILRALQKRNQVYLTEELLYGVTEHMSVASECTFGCKILKAGKCLLM